MKTVTLTIEQITDIFRAGVNRGHEEAHFCANSRFNEDLVDAVEEAVNAGKKWDAEDRVPFETIREWIGD